MKFNPITLFENNGKKGTLINIHPDTPESDTECISV